jgi:hypothetical protein
MTKATTAEGDDIRRSINWVVSRRGRLNVFDDALECGDWRISYDAIDEAVLFSTRQMMIPCYVLKVVSAGKIYQFGLNPNSYWKGEMPFPVVREKMRLKYSWFSFSVRAALIACVAYFVWKRFL